MASVNIAELIRFHQAQNTLATLTVVQLPGRFGTIALTEDQTLISSFHEKPKGDTAWINGGYFVLEPEVIDWIDGDDTSWEHEPLQKLAQMGQLSAYKHSGCWQPMDTLHDRVYIQNLWNWLLAAHGYLARSSLYSESLEYQQCPLESLVIDCAQAVWTTWLWMTQVIL